MPLVEFVISGNCRNSHDDSDANLPIFDPFLAYRPCGEAFFTGNTSGINNNKSHCVTGCRSDGIDNCKIATRNRKDYHMNNDYMDDGDDGDNGDDYMVEIEGVYDETSFGYGYENIIHHNNVTAASYYQQGSTNSYSSVSSNSQASNNSNIRSASSGTQASVNSSGTNTSSGLSGTQRSNTSTTSSGTRETGTTITCGDENYAESLDHYFSEELINIYEQYVLTHSDDGINPTDHLGLRYIYHSIYIIIHYSYIFLLYVSILKCAKTGYFKIDTENSLQTKVRSCKTIFQLEFLFTNDHKDKLRILKQHLEHILSFKKKSFYNVVKQNGGVNLLQFDIDIGIFYFLIFF